jgi:hypothetical protein
MIVGDILFVIKVIIVFEIVVGFRVGPTVCVAATAMAAEIRTATDLTATMRTGLEGRFAHPETLLMRVIAMFVD